jgi:hypothetical protein
MAALSLFGILTSVAGSGVWGAALIEVLLAVGFMGFYVAGTVNARKAAD